MKIAIIDPVGGHGGMDYYDYGLAQGIASVGVEVIYHTSKKTNLRLYPNVQTKFTFQNLWDKQSKIKKIIAFFSGYRNAFKQTKKQRITIVHLHFFDMGWLNMLVLKLAKVYGLKTVVTIHDVDPFVGKVNTWEEKLAYKLTDAIIVHNQLSKKELLNKNILPNKINIISHGNYLPFISKADIKQKEMDAPLELLFFGQIKEVKGLDILLKAMGEAVKSNTNLRLTIAGKPWKEDLNYYTQLIEKLELKEYVTTQFSYIPDNEVANYFANAHLVILPYKRIYQSGVLLLAMSYEKPVLCSNLEAFEEIVSHNNTGFVFENGNVCDLTKKIITIEKNREQLNLVQQNAFNLIEKEFNWTHIGGQTKQLYQSLLL